MFALFDLDLDMSNFVMIYFCNSQTTWGLIFNFAKMAVSLYQSISCEILALI